jgi:hypothetical protein
MIDAKWIVSLKGRDYPVFAGVLDAATKAGLRSLRTTIVQVPDASNGHMAIVLVRAEFEDGRIFESVGDASPANCSAPIATAALRMAETRGAGRAMRNAINVGQTMFEEIPDDENRATAPTGQASVTSSRGPEAAPEGGAPAETDAAPEGQPARHAQQCEYHDANGTHCQRFLTGKQCAESKQEFAHYLCPGHATQLRKARAAKAAKAQEDLVNGPVETA